jgi:hypothetical protein
VADCVGVVCTDCVGVADTDGVGVVCTDGSGGDVDEGITGMTGIADSTSVVVEGDGVLGMCCTGIE